MDAVVLYATNDYRFFKPCVKNLLDCGFNVHVVAYTHMWNGSPENLVLLDSSHEMFQTDAKYKKYTIPWESGKTPWYWEGYGRYLATQQISTNSEYTLYIDIDEIVEPKKFKDWLCLETYKQYDALKLATYWYWREPIYQAAQIEDSVVFVKSAIAKEIPLTSGGREVYVNKSSNVARYVNKESPMVHHYSWVRTKNEMLKKVENWGHAKDKSDWKALVEEEFSREFTGRDFLHGYSYNTVENIFNL